MHRCDHRSKVTFLLHHYQTCPQMYHICIKCKPEDAMIVIIRNICDWILENLPFGCKQTFEKTRLKIFTMFLTWSFFAHLDKATIKHSCCEVSHQKLLFPRRYRWLYQINRCAQKVGFPRSSHIYTETWQLLAYGSETWFFQQFLWF